MTDIQHTDLQHPGAEIHGPRFLRELRAIAESLDSGLVDEIALRLRRVREEQGRVFVIGVGGGAGNATHAVCDLRALAGLEAYAPTDNAAALTAAINDHGWRDSFARWLRGSRVGSRDAVVIFSVGGGSEDPPVSVNIVEAVREAVAAGAFVCGVVGPDGGVTAQLADVCVRVPVAGREYRTTHTEIFQAVVWHMLVTHPALALVTPRWEALRP
jgi:D-sedoheptulose 7-phosphate isomerase